MEPLPADSSPSEEPPVHSAARRGDLEELERLFAGGADLNAYSGGLTPLMVAARSLDGAGVETLWWLLEHGADLRLRSQDGLEVTAAWYAAGAGRKERSPPSRPEGGWVERLRYLLDAGLDPLECSPHGSSLVAQAAGAGDALRVKLLLERGASPDPRMNRAGQAMDAPPPKSERNRCREQNLPAISQEAAKNRGGTNPFEGQPSLPEIPLFCAARSGSADCVRLLLAAGVPPDTVDCRGATALFHASSPEATRALLEAGADPFVVDHLDRDPLQAVLEKERPLVTSISNPLNPLNPLNRLEIARLLVEAGVDLDRLDSKGRTRLYRCAAERMPEAVEFLLEAGAAPLRTVPLGPNPFFPAAGGTALHAVCEKGGGHTPELEEACERTIDLLVRAGIPVDQPDAQGCAPIHKAAGWLFSGNPSAIRALSRHGADIDLPTPTGVTPLMIAAGHSEIECIRLLLQAGADPLRKDGDGRTAGDQARRIYQFWQGTAKLDPELAPSPILENAAVALRIIERAAGETGRSENP